MTLSRQGLGNVRALCRLCLRGGVGWGRVVGMKNVTLSAAAILALKWFACETGTFADPTDRAPESALMHELRAAGLIFASGMPTAKGEALLAEMAKLVAAPVPMLPFERAVKQRRHLATVFGKPADAERVTAKFRAEWPAHDVQVAALESGAFTVDRSVVPMGYTREDYRAHCEATIRRLNADGWNLCMPVEFA